MSYCDTCMHHNVCGVEGVDDEGMTYCADRLEPCEDAISRQAALDVVSGIDRHFVKYIKELPSVTPKQGTGHWIKNTNDYHASCYVCSECGRWHPAHNHCLGFDYCNGCGARMVEPQESEEQADE